MAVFQMVNVLTGTPEGAKYREIGLVEEIWTVTLPTTLAANDTVNGPVIPAGNYLVDLAADVADLDTGGTPTLAFSVGIAGTAARFIAAGNTLGRTGGIATANVSGSIGFTAATNTQIVTTFTAAAQTPAAGIMRLRVGYTANP
jgi:hypothetical protein